MTLTLSDGPLAAGAPDTTNYRIEGPAHKILWTDFPRRVRAVVDGQVLLDTTRGKLLHESNILPVLYVPLEDVESEMLEATDHSTHCPFKGDASYWTVVVGDRRIENAVWGYADPQDEVAFLADHVAVYFDRMDAWYDEDEHVEGHLRDPYHRVDARRTSRHVVVRAGDRVLADSRRAMLVSETGLPNRWYLPAEDISAELVGSTTRSHCPYKGWASYWSLADGSADDLVFGYEEPHDDMVRAAGLRCFWGDAVTITVDGVEVPA